MQPKTELRTECTRLRVEERMSLREIRQKTGASQGSLSMWLRPYPLTEQEQKLRAPSLPVHLPKDRGEESDLHRIIRTHNHTPSHIGRVSEAAVLLRLLAHGHAVYGSPFDGDKADWVVDTGTRLLRIQVKTTHQGATGLPAVKLMRNHGKSMYMADDFDFMVGYNLFTDTAYVWKHSELTGKQSVSIAPAAEERWDKLTMLP